MNSEYIFVILFAVFCACQSNTKKMDFKSPVLEYPETFRDSVVDDYHGHPIADPFRWLEDDHSEPTEAWVDAENHVTQQYLSQIPYRDLLKKRLEELWNFERYGIPFKKGGKYFFLKNDGLQNQSVLYSQTKLDEPAKVVLDPNTFSDDGTIALSSISFNKSGTLLAYQTAEGGSDWQTIYVMDLASDSILRDRIHWVKFSGISWAGNGFYYSRFPTPSAGEKLSGENRFHKIYYHQLGTEQSDDKVIMQNEQVPQRIFFAQTTDDERFLCISSSESTSGNALQVEDLESNVGPVKLVEKFDADYEVLDNVGDRLYLLTNKDAPNRKLQAVDLSHAIQPKWTTILDEQDDVLNRAQIVGGKIFAEYLVDAKSVLRAYSLAGELEGEVNLPGIGSIDGLSGQGDDPELFYSFTNYTTPPTIYSLDAATLKSSVFKEASLKMDIGQFETVQQFYQSKDGTRIPIFITYKKGLKLDGSNPAILYGYGGFNISLTPSFSIPNLVLLENGGVYAVANLRGGGEYGKVWHLAGTKEKKQNVFDDFHAAAEYLINQKYTSSDKLAIMGGSNGGLLVGACMTQRPDLYGVAIPRVGVLDMLRYHEFTIGWAWAEDYGLSENPEDFEYLIKYSPLHNVESRSYPATFIMTADHDDRVVPAHSFKFAAELQSKQQGDNPILIRIETSAGHGAGKPTSKLIEENADMLSFLFYNMDEEIVYKNLDK